MIQELAVGGVMVAIGFGLVLFGQGPIAWFGWVVVLAGVVVGYSWIRDEI